MFIHIIICYKLEALLFSKFLVYEPYKIIFYAFHPLSNILIYLSETILIFRGFNKRKQYLRLKQHFSFLKRQISKDIKHMRTRTITTAPPISIVRMNGSENTIIKRKSIKQLHIFF